MKNLTVRQLVVYRTLILLFQSAGITPADAIPAMRALADEAEQIQNERLPDGSDAILVPGPAQIQ